MSKNFFRKKESNALDEFSTNASGDSGQESLMSNEEGFINMDEVVYINNKNPNKAPRKTSKRILMGIVTILIGGVILLAGMFFGSGEEIIPISPSQIKAEANNKLVYLQGSPTAQDFSDPLFNISASGRGLMRVVEMYQWSPDNGSFIKKWSEEPIKISDEEAKSKGYVNPEEMPFHSEKWLADKVTIGSFTISPELVSKLTSPQPIAMTEETFKQMHPEGQKAFKLAEGSYFFGINYSQPNIGDLKISFKSLPSLSVSIVAKQSGDSIIPYVGANGTIAVIREGNVDIKEISKDIDFGGSIIIKLASYAAFGFFVMIGIFIVIGKNPLSGKKNGNETGNKTNKESKAPKESKKNDNEIIIEEVEVAGTNSYEDVKLDPIDNFMTEAAPQNLQETLYVDPIFAAPQGGNPDKPTQTKLAPIEKTQTTPYSLEFTPEASNIAVEPQLQQLGVTEENAMSIPNIEAPAELFIPLVIADNPIVLPAPHEPANYSSSEFDIQSHEEMPFEVEVLNDFDSPEEPKQTSLSLELSRDSLPAVSETIINELPQIEAKEMTDIFSQPYTESFLHQDSLQIPEGVEVISEFEMENGNFAKESTQTEFPSIDFYPDKNTASPQEIHITANQNEESYIEDAGQFEDLPKPPVYEDVSAKEDAMPEVYAEEPSILLPPVPNFNATLSEEKLTENKPAAPKTKASPALLPPPPDFDSLFIAPKAKEVEPKDQNKTVTFELPPLPDNFDPNAEMTAPEEHANPFADVTTAIDDTFDPMSDDTYSPFGEITDNPFATPNDEKNNHAND